MRRLYVLRHAKSDWSTGLPDHARPLNGRGVRSATAIGRFLADSGEVPELVVTSTATRARTTADLVVGTAGWDVPIRETERLYHTFVMGALEVIAREGASAGSMMVVGHQPAWGGLVEYLTGARVDVKTATVVALDTNAGWSALGEGICSIGFVIHPRMLPESRS